ncbi:MAG: EAL domain-containing protein, partial [Deltaproteobacteria bacterium]|nr:EAL domain-containing protein [Deltaproteobacteria bacterium]
ALKIDRSFIGELEGGGRGATIASAIMALSRGLSMDVVVEGVETEAQLDFVERHGEAEVQGLVFAPPMTPDELAAWSPPPRAIAEEDQSGVYAAGFRATGTG